MPGNMTDMLAWGRRTFFKPTSAMNKRNDFLFLDGMRGIAALLVTFYHLSNAGFLGIGPITAFGDGVAGVSMFFLLSSFLLTYIFIGKLKKGDAMAVEYTARRVLRIYPLYIAYLVFALVTSSILFGLTGEERGAPFYIDVIGFLKQLILIEGRGVTWSIVVEVQYYFILPFVAWAMHHLYQRSVFVFLAATAVMLTVVGAVWPMEQMIPTNLFIGFHVYIFVLGSALGCVCANGGFEALRDRMGAAGFSRAMTAVGVISSVLFVFHLGFWPDGLQLPIRDLPILANERVVSAVISVGLIVGCLYGHKWLRLPFEGAFFRYCGAISFSIYLNHTIIISVMAVLGFSALPLLAWAICLVATIVMSHVTFSVIEVPFSRINPYKVFRRFVPAK